ncbi:MAG: DUF7230 family protein [Candidatus Methylumidiphilus sp.]
MDKKSRRDNTGARSPVARYAHKFNRSTVFADRKRYRRTEKHKGSEPSARALPA